MQQGMSKAGNLGCSIIAAVIFVIGLILFINGLAPGNTLNAWVGGILMAISAYCAYGWGKDLAGQIQQTNREKQAQNIMVSFSQEQQPAAAAPPPLEPQQRVWKRSEQLAAVEPEEEPSTVRCIFCGTINERFTSTCRMCGVSLPG